MGIGFKPWRQERIQKSIHEIRGLLNEIIVDINIIQDKQKSIFNFILFPSYYSKIKRLENQKHRQEKYLESLISELKDYEQQKKTSDEFYHNLKPKPAPKCLLCGNVELSKDPITHNCGGKLKNYVPDVGTIKINRAEPMFQFLYDEYGNVKMMEPGNNGESIESTGSYFERKMILNRQFEKFLKQCNIHM